MVVIYGTRFYGSLDKCGPTRIATRFVHIYYLPLIPIGSSLILDEDPDAKTYRAIGLGLHLRSTLAAYARVWLPVAALASLGTVYSAVGRVHRVGWSTVAIDALFATAMAVLAVLAWSKLGKLTRDERAQRLVYSELTGFPADPALLRADREPLRQRLVATVQERASRLAATGYRMGPDPASEWDKIALDPSVRDREFLGAALTLARLDWSLARAADRPRLAERHQKIWKKLLEVEPALVEQATVV